MIGYSQPIIKIIVLRVVLLKLLGRNYAVKFFVEATKHLLKI